MTAPAADGPTCFLIPEVRALLAQQGVAASRLDHSAGGFCGKTTLLGNVSFVDVPRVAARTLAEAASSENYFLSGLTAQSDYWWFPLKSTLTEEATSFTTSASPVPLLASTVTPAMHFTDNCMESSETRGSFGTAWTESLAGLRNTAEVISRRPFHRQLGSILSQLFAEVFFEKIRPNVNCC